MPAKDDEILRLMICDASFLTLREKLSLFDKAGSFYELSTMECDDLSIAVGRVLKNSTWNGKNSLKKAEISYNLLKKFGIQWTSFEKDDYPYLLREIADAPYMIFYRGSLDCLLEKCVSVVGTRKVTYSAAKDTELFAKEAGDDKTVVISGLAFGVDSCAHRGALKSSFKKTVAVLPCGIDTVVPEANKRLAAKILENGGVIMSEYTPGTPAQSFRYIQRNRIIAGLSPATVVTQAPPGSGAMTTAEFALDYNRDVFFHRACFSEESAALKKVTDLELEKKNIAGEIRQESFVRKKGLTPESFVQDGANIIENYADYCLKI